MPELGDGEGVGALEKSAWRSGIELDAWLGPARKADWGVRGRDTLDWPGAREERERNMEDQGESEGDGEDR